MSPPVATPAPPTQLRAPATLSTAAAASSRRRRPPGVPPDDRHGGPSSSHFELSFLPAPPEPASPSPSPSRPSHEHPSAPLDSFSNTCHGLPADARQQHPVTTTPDLYISSDTPPPRYAVDPLPSPPVDSSAPLGAPPASFVTRLIMKAKAHLFPLLRSSPAVGTGSYGALQSPGSPDASNPNTDDEMSEAEGLLSPGASWRRRRMRRRRSRHMMTIGEAESRRVSGAQPLDGAVEETPLRDENSVIDLDAMSDSDDDDPNDPEDNSPYPEVRASVLATDDETLSINTPRMWILSLLFSLVGSSTNLFFSLRYPSISITPVIALLLAHPLGKLWDQVFQEDEDDEGKGGVTGWLRRWLGQGRWNRKEHACVYISSNVSFGFAFATDAIVEQTHFYNQNPGILYQILLTLSTQILGYTFAGLTRQWLVRPASMIWPGTLMSTAMFTTLHGEENKPANGWVISRWKFFIYVFLAGFLWYFIPGFLFPALSYFNVITWFAPKNVIVSNLFGVRSGLGMFPVTFDWAQISYIGSPLMTPFWAAVNVVGGLVTVMWIIAPLLYYANAFYSSYMPILSSNVFDNTGKQYDVSRILTKDFLFDEHAYKSYSKVFMPITYVLSYGLQFAALTALVSHTICWHGRDIWRQARQVWDKPRPKVLEGSSSGGAYAPIDDTSPPATAAPKRRRRRRLSAVGEAEWEEIINGEDVHCRLMKRYEECPTSWYMTTFLVMIAIAIFVVEYYPVHLPWYGLLLALSVCGVFFVPIGIVMAITNTQSSLFLVCQLICGTLFPGRPVANMLFVMYGYITSTQGLKFASDLKLGHYMKIPPKLLFKIQFVATLVSSFTQIGVLNWMFANIPGICTNEALNGFSCPIARVHFNGSILWGVVGPARFFGSGELYRPLVWAFLVGLVCPVVIWAIWNAGGRNRKSILKRVSFPVLFGSLSWIPPATGLNFSSWAIVCYVFNSMFKRRRTEWWGKYTMTLSAALDASLAFGLVVVFFAIMYPGWSWLEKMEWWGTEVYKEGCDWQGCAYGKLPEGGKFGPDQGTW